MSQHSPRQAPGPFRPRWHRLRLRTMATSGTVLPEGHGHEHRMAALRARNALERLKAGRDENFHPARAALHHLEWFAFGTFGGAHGGKR